MFDKGALQRRQSEGKNVANKLSAARFIWAAKDETKAGIDACSLATVLVPVVRVRSRLLLKTNLPRPAGAMGPSWKYQAQYNGAECLLATRRVLVRQPWVKRPGRELLRVGDAQEPEETIAYSLCESTWRSAPDGARIWAANTFRSESGDENENPEDCHNHYNGIAWIAWLMHLQSRPKEG